MGPLDLGSDLGHVEYPHLVDQALQGDAWQHAGLLKKQDAISKCHQGRDRLDAERRSQPGLLLGVHLGKGHIGIGCGGLLEDRGKSPTWSAPGRPPIHENDAIFNGDPEVSRSELRRCHVRFPSVYWSQRWSKGFEKVFGNNTRVRGDRLNMR